MKCNTGCASYFAAVKPMECMSIKPLYIFYTVDSRNSPSSKCQISSVVWK